MKLVKVLYCKLLTNGKQLPAVPLVVGPGSKPDLRGGRRECYTLPPLSQGSQGSNIYPYC